MVPGTTYERSEQKSDIVPPLFGISGYNWKLHNEKTITRNTVKPVASYTNISFKRESFRTQLSDCLSREQISHYIIWHMTVFSRRYPQVERNVFNQRKLLKQRMLGGQSDDRVPRHVARIIGTILRRAWEHVSRFGDSFFRARRVRNISSSVCSDRTSESNAKSGYFCTAWVAWSDTNTASTS